MHGTAERARQYWAPIKYTNPGYYALMTGANLARSAYNKWYGTRTTTKTSRNPHALTRKYRRKPTTWSKYKRIHPRKEIKVFYFSGNNTMYAFQPLKCVNAVGPDSVGFYGNQLMYIFTPAQGTSVHEAIGAKVVVKSIKYKFLFAQGNIPDVQTAPPAPFITIPFNIRVICLKVRENPGNAHIDIGNILTLDGSTSINWDSQGKTTAQFRESHSVQTTRGTESNFDILLNKLIELDSGYKSETLEGKINCGFTCQFFETFANTATFNHTYKNQLLWIMLTDQAYNETNTFHAAFRGSIKVKYYDA